MKVNNLFLVGVAALSLGMTACNNAVSYTHLRAHET